MQYKNGGSIINSYLHNDTNKNYNFEKYFLVLSNLQKYTVGCCCGMWNHIGPYYTADQTATTTDEEDQ